MSRNLALVLISTLCILGPTAVFVACSFASILSLGRNPSAAPKIFTAMVILIVVSVALSIILMLICFQLFSNQAG